MKEIPRGIQDFKKLRSADLYYVDKTRLIDQVLSSTGTEVFLFTRPRRFGKSLNLSMLDAYLNLDYKGNTWFDGLAVSRIRPNDSEKNSNIVVYLDMKDLGDGTYEDFVRKISFKISLLYAKYSYLRTSDRVDASLVDMFNDIYERRAGADLTQALNLLVIMLGMHHGCDVIVLIDEYDNAVNHVEESGYEGGASGSDRRRILNFVKSFLSPVLKGSDHLRFAVLTGIMRIGKESIFSGLNNLSVESVFQSHFDEAFGFTATEVERLLSDYGHPERSEEAREWYDGYRFGDADVYNPWSVLEYVYRGFVPLSYWAGTSGNGIIDRMIRGMDADLYEKFKALGRGEGVSQFVDESITYSDLTEGSEAVLSIMAMSGYLRAEKEKVPGYYSLTIPNREMSVVFRHKFDEKLGRSGSRIADLEDAVLSGDSDAVSEALGSLVMSFDPKVFSHEHAYEILCISLLMHLEGPYEVLSEMHRGRGYCDILLRSNVRSLPHVLIELKRWKDGDPDPGDLADAGLAQVHDRVYTHMLVGSVILYGVAFRGADVEVRSERIVLRPGLQDSRNACHPLHACRGSHCTA